jgi:hypothetical protein
MFRQSGLNGVSRNDGEGIENSLFKGKEFSDSSSVSAAAGKGQNRQNRLFFSGNERSRWNAQYKQEEEQAGFSRFLSFFYVVMVHFLYKSPLIYNKQESLSLLRRQKPGIFHKT